MTEDTCNNRVAAPTDYDPVKSSDMHPCIKADFDEMYQYNKPHKPAFRKRITRAGRCHPVETLLHLFPAFYWLPNYKWKDDFLNDLVSGITVAIMHIPQGMAYALLGGVAPVVGIYMAFFPVLLYVLMGTSRHISMGTFAVVCMMTSKSVMLYSDPNLTRTVLDTSLNQSALNISSTTNTSTGYTPLQVATVVCFAVGIWQVLLGICRLGVLSVLLSETLVSGFTTGAAVHVATSQLNKFLGVKVGRFTGPFKTFIDLFKSIHKANPATVIISLISIVVLAIFNELIKPRIGNKLPMPFPIELLAIITGTLVSMYANLQSTYAISVIGDIPTGLPSPILPPLELLPNVLVDGLVIAVVAFSVNMSMASIFSRKLNYSINANQELLASGCSNILGSFFSCMPFAASLSRSMIQQTVGGKTQLASVVSCLLLLLILLLIGPFFEPLPDCVLASIVVVALKSMFMQMKDVPGLWRQSPFDGSIWLATFLSVVILDIDYGLGIGVALSLLCVLVMGQRPSVCRLGHVPNTNIYLDTSRYQAATETPGICILQVAGGLHFANREHVQRKLYRLMGPISEISKPLPPAHKTPIVKEAKELGLEHETVDLVTYPSKPAKKVSCVVLDMMLVCFVDPSAIKTLLAMYNDLKRQGCMLCLAYCSATVFEQLNHCNFFSEFSSSQLFPTVHDAVLFSQQLDT